ncbi:MAG: hypothetical protein R3E89_15800 [Thiolinea sp.]
MSIKPLYRFPVASPALFLGGLLWIIACWLPVFETAQGPIAGYWVLISGWMGFAMFQFAWYANPLLLMAVILMYSAPLRATLLAALGLLLATQAFWFDALPGTVTATPIVGQGPGFWVWYGSLFLLALGVFWGSDEVAPDERDALPAQPATEVMHQAQATAAYASVEQASQFTVRADSDAAVAPEPPAVAVEPGAWEKPSAKLLAVAAEVEALAASKKTGEDPQVSAR